MYGRHTAQHQLDKWLRLCDNNYFPIFIANSLESESLFDYVQRWRKEYFIKGSDFQGFRVLN